MNIICVGLYWFEKVAIYHLPVFKGWMWASLLVAAAIAFGAWMDITWWAWLILMACIALYLALSLYAWTISRTTL